MIDNKGRIFGKINVIDAFIVLVVIAIVAFGIRIAASKGVVVNTATNKDVVVVTYYTEEVADFVSESVKIGDPVEDESKVIGLGNITDILIDKGFVYLPDDRGQVTKSFKEGYSSMEIQTEARGQLFAHGVMIEGNKYSVGHTFTIRAGYGKILARIKSIELKGSVNE